MNPPKPKAEKKPPAMKFPWRKVRLRFETGGMTRQRLSELSGIGVVSLAAILSGRYPRVNYDTIVGLQRGLGVDWGFFFTEDIPLEDLMPHLKRPGRPPKKP